MRPGCLISKDVTDAKTSVPPVPLIHVKCADLRAVRGANVAR
jgi:hypothetical protein